MHKPEPPQRRGVRARTGRKVPRGRPQRCSGRRTVPGTGQDRGSVVTCEWQSAASTSTGGGGSTRGALSREWGIFRAWNQMHWKVRPAVQVGSQIQEHLKHGAKDPQQPPEV